MEKNVKAEFFSKSAKCLFTQIFSAFQETITISHLNLYKLMVNIDLYVF